MRVDRHTLTLLETKEWSRKLAVVGSHGHNVFWSEFDWFGGNGKGVVRCCIHFWDEKTRLSEGRISTEECTSGDRTRCCKKISSRDVVSAHLFSLRFAPRHHRGWSSCSSWCNSSTSIWLFPAL